MGGSNFSQAVLAGQSDEYSQAVKDLKERYQFDFVSMGLTAFIGAPLKWLYSAGASGERYRRIVLAPGHGIGGIVVKSGKPMMFVDIDTQIDPREYSSYPIVFAEDLRSFCALPLAKQDRVVGALLCAFRTASNQHEQDYLALIEDLNGQLIDLQVLTSDFTNFEDIAANMRGEESRHYFLGKSELSYVIAAQEDERKRISREIHDGIAQEILGVSFLLNRFAPHISTEEGHKLLKQTKNTLDCILNDLHDLSVDLRPSTLDHLGLVSALHSQADVYEKTYGPEIIFEGSISVDRFDRAMETQAYRICQEALLNACKYSESDTITIAFEDVANWLQITIKDKGCGFDTENPQIKGRGCGLHGMRERANLVGANLTIESSSEGTTVTLVLPLETPSAPKDNQQRRQA